jgi:hypothetical protein
VPNCFAIRRRLARAVAALFSLVLATVTVGLARASALTSVSDCSASGDSLKCHLLGVLNFLYAAAGLLGILLIAVVVLAFKSFRKNKTDEKADS